MSQSLIKNPIFHIIAVSAAVLFLFNTVLQKLIFDWWHDENYSHGLLMPFVIGFIVWSEFDELKKACDKPSLLAGLGLILLSLATLLAGTLGAELFVQRVAFVMMLVGIIYLFFGKKILKLLAVPVALLIFSIPIPQIIFNQIAFPLQLKASQLAVWGVRLFSVPTVRKGNVIDILPAGSTQILSLEVVEACSGIRSLMTLMALAVVLGYLTREQKPRASMSLKQFLFRPDLWRTVLLVISAIPIAVLTNAARVTATGVFTYHYGRVALEGFWHDAAGWMVFVSALILLVLVNLVLRKLLKPRHEISEISESTSRPTAFSTGLSFAVIVGLILGGVMITWLDRRGDIVVPRKELAAFPASIGKWNARGSDLRFDEATESVLKTTDYLMREYSRDDGRVANIYVGYYRSQRTGVTYHSPQNCLPGAGWVMKDADKILITPKTREPFEANFYVIENGRHSEVMLYWYQGRGRIAASEYTDKINTVADSLFRRRSDGAMVRIMTGIGSDRDAAVKAAADLATETADNLSAFVPD